MHKLIDTPQPSCSDPATQTYKTRRRTYTCWYISNCVNQPPCSQMLLSAQWRSAEMNIHLYTRTARAWILDTKAARPSLLLRLRPKQRTGTHTNGDQKFHHKACTTPTDVLLFLFLLLICTLLLGSFFPSKGKISWYWCQRNLFISYKNYCGTRYKSWVI